MVETSGPAANNVVLIGMPGAGKSTVGVLLAKATSRDFLDTDVALQARQQRTLQQLLASEGIEGFRRVEEDVVLTLECHDTVIATGGSVVYGQRGMAHLKAGGVVVYLKLPLAILADRIRDVEGRGVVMTKEQTLEDLLAERAPLYEGYADVTVDCQELSHEGVLGKILEALKRPV